MAEEKGFDLVEVSPDNKPPVCKLMDYGKYKYEQQKKANEARKKQKVIEIKEIKMRPTIDDHDYDVKMRAMKRFFDEGDKVKVTLRFRGREMAHQHLGMDLLTRVQKDTEVFAKTGTVSEDGRPPDDDGARPALTWSQFPAFAEKCYASALHVGVGDAGFSGRIEAPSRLSRGRGLCGRGLSAAAARHNNVAPIL